MAIYNTFSSFLQAYVWYILLALVALTAFVFKLRKLLAADKSHITSHKDAKMSCMKMIQLLKENSEITILVKNLTRSDYPYFIVYKSQDEVALYFLDSAYSGMRYYIKVKTLEAVVNTHPNLGVFGLLRMLAKDTKYFYEINILEPYMCKEVLAKTITPDHIV